MRGKNEVENCNCLEMVAPFIAMLQENLTFVLSILTVEQSEMLNEWIEVNGPWETEVE